MGKAKITAFDSATKVYTVNLVTDTARLAQRIKEMEETQAELVKKTLDAIVAEQSALAAYKLAKLAFDLAVKIYRANCT